MLTRIRKKLRGFTLIELMIVVAIIGILAAIAIPNFIRFQAKSKQSEAKANLKTLYTAEKAYFGEKDAYSTDFLAVGFTPEGGNRYTYSVVGQNVGAKPITSRSYSLGIIEQDQNRFPTTPTAGAEPVASTVITPPSADFVAVAQGNIDNDALADTWVIVSMATGATMTGTCGIDTTSVGSGSPANGYNDVSCDP
jgi:type IV pilus assembly protein PilA